MKWERDSDRNGLDTSNSNFRCLGCVLAKSTWRHFLNGVGLCARRFRSFALPMLICFIFSDGNGGIHLRTLLQTYYNTLIGWVFMHNKRVDSSFLLDRFSKHNGASNENATARGINPFTPKIRELIFQTDDHTFRCWLVRRIWCYIKTIFPSR